MDTGGDRDLDRDGLCWQGRAVRGNGYHRPGRWANVAARLSSQARAGEILLSAASYAAARLASEGLESRVLELKGRSEPMEAWNHQLIGDRLTPAGRKI